MDSLREKAITARIVSLSEERCIACGRCHATHYCDAFTDRARRYLPPLLEPRNCTGCGLCAQLCPRGALQLYKPEHMLVLLDDHTERHDILNELGVPHLCIATSDADQIKALSDAKMTWDTRKILASIVNATTRDAGCANLKAILLDVFKRRVGSPPGEKGCGLDSFCLRKGKEKLYAECRYDSLNPKGVFIGDDLAQGLSSIWADRGLREAYGRAAIWAMLIWTDPGQVLVLSPIVVVHTELNKGTQGSCHIVNHVVVLRGRLDGVGRPEISIKLITENSPSNKYACGPIALSLPGPSFSLAQLTDSEMRLYNASGYREGRLDGLDIRGAGRFLFEDYDHLSADDRLAIAGLPWSTIKTLPGIDLIVEEMKKRSKSSNIK